MPVTSPRVRSRPTRLIARGVLAAATVASCCAFASSAGAVPVTVNLRVEGSSQTLFEGQVTTDAETITTPSSGGPHPCDYSDNGPGGGFANGGTPGGTPTTALHDAAVAGGLSFDAQWFGTGASNGNPGDFFVSQVGSDINQSSAPFASWGYAVGYTTASVGGCQIKVSPGTNILWAYDYFNKSHLLLLAGPASASTGTPITVTVTDGQNGQPISGASVGGQLTDSAGHATLTFQGPGVQTLKASRSDSVRSNALSICVHTGNDGSCGTAVPPAVVGPTATGAPSAPKAIASVAHIVGLSDGLRLAHRFGPRFLRGFVENGGALSDVEIRLTRMHDGRCSFFSGRRARFVPIRCGQGFFFSVGDVSNVNYLLPSRLGPGRYLFELKTVDRGGPVDPPEYGRNKVLFRVE